MKSTEVYRIINKIIFPELKSLGFKKTKSGMLGFYKQLKDHYLVIWFQCAQGGFDAYAGSKFVFEVQISRTNDIGSPSVFRERIPFFLTVDNLAKVTELENKVKDKLRLPPKTHYIFGMDENIQQWYKKKFEKVDNIYTNSSDIWFVYFDETDINNWIEFLQPVIKKVISDFEQSDY
ncbi:hypothetical protein [Sphingobacterium athyrii]|uniref:DUF4304 domain-containing protein n=1 Tax=Sphingobacterium athyrii TaxID=2152717 RepID=A0A363NTH8_9SPHI|nr:hypothetical protein [Sphingobacterium athyrii]PUV24050.1 hypothetical protein DCO56_11800 [Sphingobacterium athyrii]